jgi:hypothetical protein
LAATGQADNERARELAGRALVHRAVREQLIDHVYHGVLDGDLPPAAGSIIRITHAEIHHLEFDTVLALAGSSGVVDVGDDLIRFGERYLSRQTAALGGGTTEIARNIIGERVLGFPREYVADRDVPFNQVKRIRAESKRGGSGPRRAGSARCAGACARPPAAGSPFRGSRASASARARSQVRPQVLGHAAAEILHRQHFSLDAVRRVIHPGNSDKLARHPARLQLFGIVSRTFYVPRTPRIDPHYPAAAGQIGAARCGYWAQPIVRRDDDGIKFSREASALECLELRKPDDRRAAVNQQHGRPLHPHRQRRRDEHPDLRFAVDVALTHGDTGTRLRAQLEAQPSPAQRSRIKLTSRKRQDRATQLGRSLAMAPRIVTWRRATYATTATPATAANILAFT